MSKDYKTCEHCGEKHDDLCDRVFESYYILVLSEGHGSKVEKYILSEFHADKSWIRLVLLDGCAVTLNAHIVDIISIERANVKRAREFLATDESKEFSKDRTSTLKQWGVIRG